MIYILDSNFFIDANRLHLPLENRPDFWNFLASLAASKIITIPSQVYDEICKGNDNLKTWMRDQKGSLVDTVSLYDSLPVVLNDGYGFENEDELENINADPFVVALALSLRGTVVTSEKPRPNAAAQNKKIPDVCRALDIPCISITTFIWEILRRS